MEIFRRELEEILKSGLKRNRVISESLIDLCSNDYLGLRKNPDVIEEGIRVLREEGAGSGASQLVSGYTKYHKELEEKIASFKEIPSCLVFGSGYLANAGTIPALVEDGDLILSDELNHASIIDGCRLSKAEKVIYKHLDYEYIESFLEKYRHKYNRVLIITDSVFSMEGDMADIKRLVEISDKYEAMLYIDDAHATGVIGEGKGGLQEFNCIWKENIIVMGTLSKAIGSYGAFVCCSEILSDYLLNKARTLIFSTSLPPHICASAKKSIDIIEEKKDLVENLRKRTEETYQFLKYKGLSIRWHGTPIIPIIIGNEEKAVFISERLKEEGILLRAIRYPAVKKNEARLRLTVSLGLREDVWFSTIERVIELIRKHI